MIWGSVKMTAQSLGCTDMQAANYSAAATVNDGSCTYPISNYTPTLVHALVDDLAETSGLVAEGDYLWTHNDGGNAPILFQIKKSDGSIQRRVYISNGSNTDWEAMSQDETHFFIGDFGNNNGNRTDLHILKIAKSDIATSDTVMATFIDFYFPEQTEFTAAPFMTAYDCEAMIYAHDSLYLFTKDWLTDSTQIYALPTIPGAYPARLLESFYTSGQITDAAYNADRKNLVLLGYKKNSLGIYTPFAWLLFDYINHHFLSGNKRRIGLGTALALGQNEGITWDGDYKGYISGEAIAHASAGINEPAKLSYFDFSTYLSNSSSVAPHLPTSSIMLHPNPATTELYISTSLPDLSTYSIYDRKGRRIQQGVVRLHQIDISSLSAGSYLLELSGRKLISFVKL